MKKLIIPLIMIIIMVSGCQNKEEIAGGQTDMVDSAGIADDVDEVDETDIIDGSDIADDVDEVDETDIVDGADIEDDVDIETDEEDTYSFKSGLSITNNSVYDEGGKRQFDFNTLLGNFGGIEVYSEGNQTFVTNIEGNIIVTVLFKNTSNKTLGFCLGDTELAGTYMQYVMKKDVEILTHPNGCTAYVLEPGEEKTAEIDLTLPHVSINSDISESLIINSAVTITDMDNYAGTTYDLSLEETIKFITKNTFLSDEYKNAVVEGRVCDENGNPLSGIIVKVTSPFVELKNLVRTDENGKFSVTVIGAKSTYSGAWREYCMIIEDPSITTRYIPIYPKSNQTITADVTVYRPYVGYTYEEVNTVDLGLQAYESDTDQSSAIAFVPFHTGYNSADVADLIKLTVTDFDGNVLYTHDLPEEIPYVDLSEDGKYTTVVEDGSNGGFDAIILDDAGNVVYRTHDLKQADKEYAPKDNVSETISRASQLSNDNKYLVASDIDGNIWFIDWQNDEVLWSDWQMGQIRNIKFDDDNERMYVSTGGGDLLCYDLNGDIKWKADTQSWATKMEVTGKYIVMTTKCCGKSLLVINKENGEIVWDYPTLQTSMSIAVSPDEKYLWFGGHSSSAFSKIGCSIFDLDSGELVGMINDQNFDGGQFSGDGSIIVVRDDNNIWVCDAKSGQPLLKKEIAYDGSTTLNMAVAVNEDGSKFVVTMNDKGDGYYGTAHYFNLLEKRVAGDAPDSIKNKYDKDSDNENNGPYRIEGNDVVFERSAEYDGFRTYDNVTINKNVEVTLSSSDDIESVRGFIINDSLVLEEGASLIQTGDNTVSPRLEFNDGATAVGINLYSESGDLLNVDGEFFNDSGSTLAFIYKNGKWMIEV